MLNALGEAMGFGGGARQEQAEKAAASVDPNALKSAYTAQLMAERGRLQGALGQQNRMGDFAQTAEGRQMAQLASGQVDPAALAQLRAQQGEVLRGQMALAQSGRNSEGAMRSALAGAAGAQAQMGAATAAQAGQNRLAATNALFAARNNQLGADQAAEFQRRAQMAQGLQLGFQGAQLDQAALAEAERARTARYGAAYGTPTGAESFVGMATGAAKAVAAG